MHSGIDASKITFNFWNRILTDDEKEILKFGVESALPGNKLTFTNHYLASEKLVSSLPCNHSDADVKHNNWPELISMSKI